jgi:F-type H+/Na+-transporting ATPase subunit beta
VLSRKRASQALYPAVEPLESGSKMLTPGVVGKRHYRIAQQVRKTLADYEELKDIIAMLGFEELSKEDRQTVIGRDAWSVFSRSLFSPPSSLPAKRQAGLS